MLDFSQTLTPEPLVHPTSIVRNSRLGRYVELGDHCTVEESEIGDYSYCFGSNDIIYTTVGKFASIAFGVRLNPVQHPARLRAAQHHFTYRMAHYGFGAGNDDPAITRWRRENHLTIGHDVWLGHNAVVMGGITIGDGAVVGAGAVVTHPVAPYEIVAGVPARHIGWRFQPDLIQALERIRWWDWSHEELKQRLEDFKKDVAAFCAKYDR